MATELDWLRDTPPLLLEWLFLRQGPGLLQCGLWQPLDRLRRAEEEDGPEFLPPDSEEILLLQVLRALCAGRPEALERYVDSLEGEPADSLHWLARELARWRALARRPPGEALQELLAELPVSRDDLLLRGAVQAWNLLGAGRSREAGERLGGLLREARRRGAARLEELLGRWLARLEESRPEGRRGGARAPGLREARREACFLACHRYGRMVGRSAAFQELRRQLEQAAGDGLPLLLVGETGTGKELAVDYLHQLAFPAGAPLVAVNCAGLSDNLAEAELFGSVRGAFTGAVDREGLAVRADGGLLFLDEFGALPTPVQARLLRFLESGVFRPVGEARERQVRVRVAAATCEIGRLGGAFRQDLLHRVAGRVIEVPPLSRRLDDLPLLCRAFLLEAGVPQPARHPLCSPASQTRLRRAAWPGNLRQLRHLIQRLAPLTAKQILAELAVLPEDAPPAPPPVVAGGDAAPELPLREAVACFEWTRIQAALAGCGQDKRLAAQRLGISLPTLYARLKRGPGPVAARAGAALASPDAPDPPHPRDEPVAPSISSNY
ncbi:MAG: sigma 54-interacting transcriptional regulator [Candidatus Delongbacteria bacterium]